MTEPWLRVNEIDVRFGGVRALKSVSLEHRPGEILGLIGPNGAGKTTLLNVITGLIKSDSGTVQLDGRDLTGCTPQDIVAAGIVRTFQNTELYVGLTVRENVLLGTHPRTGYGLFQALLGVGRAKRREAELRDEIDRLLDSLGLAQYADDKLESLPYGLRKRIELARALALQPRVLLLDEPAAGASAEDRDALVEDIRRITTERQTSVILIEHDMRLVMSLCDRVAVLNWGEVLAVGTPDEVRADKAVEEAYLGV